jgi:carbohydrate-binding DOMON domain-containing protein
VSQQYIQAANSVSGDDAQRVGAAELHNAVIAYYRALAPLSSDGAVADYWESVELWQRDGEPVTGFDELREWAVRYRTTTTESTVGFTGKSQEQSREPVRLPPQISLRIVQQLDTATVKLGFGPPTDDTTDDPYQLGKQPTEEHNEPVDDSIAKPEQ